jgi:hypothetical protein
LRNVAVAENKTFGPSCTGCIVTPTDFALCCGMLLAQKTGHLLLLALCSLSCTMFLQRVVGIRRPEDSAGCNPPKIFSGLMSENTLSQGFENEGGIFRSIHGHTPPRPDATSRAG